MKRAASDVRLPRPWRGSARAAGWLAVAMLLLAAGERGADAGGEDAGDGDERLILFTAVDLGTGEPVGIADTGRVAIADRGPNGEFRGFVADPPAQGATGWTRTEILSGGTVLPGVTPVDMNAAGVVAGSSDQGLFTYDGGGFHFVQGPLAPAWTDPCAAQGLESFARIPDVGGPSFDLGRSAIHAIADDGSLTGFERYAISPFDLVRCPRPLYEPVYDVISGAEDQNVRNEYLERYAIWSPLVAAYVEYRDEWVAQDEPLTGPSTSLLAIAYTSGTIDPGLVEISDIGPGGHIVGLLDGRPVVFPSAGFGGITELAPAPEGFERYVLGDVNTLRRVAGQFSPATGADIAVVFEPDGTRTDLPVPDPERDAAARSINDAGVIVGLTAEFLIFRRDARAAMWDEAGFCDLDEVVAPTAVRFEDGTTYDLLLTEAVGINARGDIVCRALVLPDSIEQRVVVLEACDSLRLTPGSVDFGDVEIGRTATVDLVAVNCTQKDVKAAALKPKAPFRIAGPASRRIPGGLQGTFRYTFRPASPQEFSQTIQIRISASETITAVLRGRGVPLGPQLLVFPNPMEFGPTVRGDVDYPLVIQNLRDEPVRVTLGTLAQPFHSAGKRTLTIPARGTVMRPVSFLPVQQGDFSETMTLTTNVPGAPVQTVTFTGRLSKTVRVRRIVGAPESRKLPGDYADLTDGQELDEGTEIATDPDSEVEVEFPDGSTTIIRPGTLMKVAALFTAGGRVQTEILLTTGALAAKVRKSDVIRSDFVIRGPAATASVRGTEFEMIHDDAGATTRVVVSEGVVDVDPGGAGLKTVRVKAGREVTVTATSIGKVVRTPK